MALAAGVSLALASNFWSPSIRLFQRGVSVDHREDSPRRVLSVPSGPRSELIAAGLVAVGAPSGLGVPQSASIWCNRRPSTPSLMSAMEGQRDDDRLAIDARDARHIATHPPLFWSWKVT